MANLEFCDKHNMVAYLKKPTRSEGFQDRVDFLNGSHIRFALTKNPTIYVSLIKIFWQTATVRTVDNGEQEITATVDGKEFTITEASVRRHLQLADVEGISALPTTEIFDQLSLMGEQAPLFQSMLVIQAAEGEGSGHPYEPQPPPSTAQPINKEPILIVVSSSHQKTQTPRQALKEVTELTQTSGSPRCQEAMGGSIAQTRSEKVPTQSYDSPLPRVNTLGSDEGSMTLHELTVLCTKLSNKVESLETELKQTKQTYGAAFTKLIKKVKKLEQTVKTSQARRRAKIIVSDDEEDSEDSSKQGRKIDEIDQDPDITLMSSTCWRSAAKDKGKAKMDESELEQTKTKLQQRQERAGYEAATEIIKEVLELATGSLKRDVEEEVDQGSSKRQKTSENSEPAEESKEKEDDELSQEELQQLMIIVPE
ncbi:hypothetical protein Tco_0670929 [Tanacetum coccineum]